MVLGGQSRTRAQLSLVGVVALLASLIVGVARAAGEPTRKTRFTDDAVWEINRATGRVSHWNPTVDLVGSTLKATRRDLISIEQDNGGVVVVNESTQSLQILDDVELKFAAPIKIAPDAQVHVTDDWVVVVEPKAGRVLRASQADLMNGMDLDKAAVIADQHDPIVAEVGRDASVYVLVPDTGAITRYGVDGSVKRRWSIGPVSKSSQLSAIGSKPVVLDGKTGNVFLEQNRIATLTTIDAILAMPSQQDDAVYVSDQNGVVSRIASADKAVDNAYIASVGPEPIRPLVDDRGCVAAASSGTGVVRYRCPRAASQQLADSLVGPLFGRIVRGGFFIDALETDRAVRGMSSGEVKRISDAAIEAQKSLVAAPEGNQDTPQKGDDDKKESNEKPKAAADSFKVRPNRLSILPVLANDTDPNGDLLSVVSVSGSPTGASVSVGAAGGNVTFRPDPGFVGSVAFQVTIADEEGETDTNEVQVTVDDLSNAAPLAVADTASTTATQKSLIDVLANDTDPDGDTLAVTAATLTSGVGTVEVGQFGVLAFAGTGPGTAIVTYAVQDERGLAATGTLTITISSANNLAPIARNDVFEVQLGKPSVLDVLANDLDPDGGRLQITTVPKTVALLGPITEDGSVLRLSATQLGEQSFTYRVSDGQASSQASVVVRVVRSVGNRPPLALPDRLTLSANAEATVDVVANDSDPDGDTLGVVSWTTERGMTIRTTDSRHLIVAIDSTVTNPTVVLYSLSDGTTSVQGTLLVTPSPKVANLPPVANDDRYGVRLNVGRTMNVLANDGDPENSVLAIKELVGNPIGMSISENRKQIVVAPSANPQNRKFAYVVADAQGATAQATVDLVVNPDPNANGSPVLRPDKVTTRSNSTVLIPVLANDDDPDGDSLTIINPGLPVKGSVVAADGFLQYEPAPGALGTDRFSYSVIDGHGGIASGEVTVGILPPPKQNRAPVARPDGPKTVRVGDNITIDVIANDVDPDNDPMTVTAVGSFDKGTVVIDGPRTVTFRAPTDPGTYTVSYTVSDNSFATDTSTVTLVVEPNTSKGLPPVAVPDALTITPRSTAIACVLDNDTDPDGDASALRIFRFDSKNATLNPDARCLTVSAPTTNEVIRYIVRDGQGNVATGSLSVTLGPDTTLVARDDNASVAAAGTVEIDVLANDTGANKPLSIARVGQSEGGAVTLIGRDKISFAANQGFVGLTTFSYTVQDTIGNTKNANVRILVNGTKSNQPPTARSVGPVSLLPGQSSPVDLASVAKDPEGGPLSFTIVADSERVQSQLQGSTLRLQAPPDSTPADVAITYQVTDQTGLKAQNQVFVRLVGPPVTTQAPVTTAVPPTSTAAPATPASTTAPPTLPPTTAVRLTTPPTIPATIPATIAPTLPPSVPNLVSPPTIAPTTAPTNLNTPTPPSTTLEPSTTVTTQLSRTTTTPVVVTQPTVASTLPPVATTAPLGTTTTSSPSITSTTGEVTTTIAGATTTTLPGATTTTTTTTTTLPGATTTVVGTTTTTTTTTATTTTTTTTTTTAVPANRLPGAPRSVAASASGALVSVSWTAPTDLGLPVLTHYNATFNGADGSHLVTVTGNSAQYTATATGSYTVTIVGCNPNCGPGTASNAVTATIPVITTTTTAVPNRAPSSPGGISGQPNGNTVSFTWAPPSDPGVPSTVDYLVAVTGPTPGLSTQTRTPNAFISSPAATTPGTYSVGITVSACNTTGCGPAQSTTTSLTIQPTPPGAPSLSVTPNPGAGGFDISWTAPSDWGGATTGLRTTVYGNGAVVANEASANSGTHFVGGVAPGATVRFTIESCNAAACTQGNAVDASLPPPNPAVNIGPRSRRGGFASWTVTLTGSPGTTWSVVQNGPLGASAPISVSGDSGSIPQQVEIATESGTYSYTVSGYGTSFQSASIVIN